MVPPVSRSGFFHSGDSFYVDFDGHHHHRQPVQALYKHLTFVEPAGPVLTKTGKVAKQQPLPFKDHPGHFYCAQLLHYGLRPLKTKIPAKKALLEEFKDGKMLKVPDHIVLLEKDLLNEYTKAQTIATHKAKDAERKREKQEAKKQKEALATQQAQKAGTQADIASNSHKRKAPGASNSSTNPPEPGGHKSIPIKQLKDTIKGMSEEDLKKLVCGLVGKDPQLGSAIQAYREKIDKPAAKRTKQAAKKTMVPIAGPLLDYAAAGPSPTQIAGNATLPNVPPIEIGGLGLSEPIRPRTKQTARKTNRPDLLPNILAGASNHVGGNLNSADLQGGFRVDAPQLESNWDVMPEDGFSLGIHPSLGTQQHLWGSFNFGIISGVLRSCPNSVGSMRSPKIGMTVRCLWRGKPDESSESTFDDDNDFVITFLGAGRIQGFIRWNTEPFHFTGVHDGEQMKSEDVGGWKYEYRGYNWQNYEVANRARWGSWGGDTKQEHPATSDTSNGGEDSDVEMEYGDVL